MAARKRVFLITRDPSRLAEWTAEFERRGWEVVSATSPEEGRQKLTGMWVHVLVIDLQCKNPDDPNDYTGAEIAKAKGGATDRILWISEMVRAALVPNDREREVGVYTSVVTPDLKYVQERDGVDKLVSVAEHCYQTRFNAELLLHPAICGFLAELVEEMPEYNQASDHEKGDAIRELEDILRCIFCEIEANGLSGKQLYQRLKHVDDISFHNGTGILIAQPRTDTGWAAPRVIKLGRKQLMEAELAISNASFAPLLGPKALPIEFVRFGGVQYHRDVPSKGEILTFRKYSEDKTSADAQMPLITIPPNITETIESLAKDWWPGQTKRLDRTIGDHVRQLSALGIPFNNAERLVALLREDVDLALSERWFALNQSVSDILTRRRIPRLRFKDNGDEIEIFVDDRHEGTYPNPVRFVESAHRTGLIPLPSSWCLSTGIRNSYQILVTKEGKVWMVDLSNARWAPLWRDFAALESIIKFELVAINRLDILFEWEKALLTPIDLGDAIPDPKISRTLPSPVISQLNESFCVIRDVVGKIRGYLAQIGVLEADDMREYYSLLLFHTLYRIIPPKDPWMYNDATTEVSRRAHALISAALICRKLKDWNEEKARRERMARRPFRA